MPQYDIVNPWIIWAKFATLVLLLLICAMQPAIWRNGVQMLVAPIQRRYEDLTSQHTLKILRCIFRFGILSLTVLCAVHAALLPDRTLTLHNWALAAALLIGCHIVKQIIDRYIVFTFRINIHLATINQHRSNIWQLAGVLLFVYIVVQEWLSAAWLWLLPCAIAGLAYLIWWWKLMNLFGWSAKHLCYCTLYFLHAEVLPVGLAVAGTRYILTK
ncbi:MAG: hypothetical protein MJZ64_06980 [Paludibacteraceae bacterium]|nr:hypothetical protein [Paludibacteraceae bacterium]